MEWIKVELSDTSVLPKKEYIVIKQGDVYGVILKENGSYELDLSQSAHLNIVVGEQLNVNVVVKIEEAVQEAHLAITVEKDAICHAFVMNDSHGVVEENHALKQNAQLYISNAELSRGTMKHKTTYNLYSEGTQLEARLAYVCDDEDAKRLNVFVEHHAKHTSSNIELYGVMKKSANLKAEVTSHIVKGARGAQAHQASRVLNFDNNVAANISPILLIDENDVEASHACSMGAVDENHLYYLQSRGLSVQAATALIVNGYLSVLSTSFDEDELQQYVLEEINKKAGV